MKQTIYPCLLALFLAVFIVFVPSLAAFEESPYGICAHLQGGEEHQQMPKNLELMRKAGIRWVRSDFSWGGVEPTEGNWKFEHLDRVVAEVKKNDMMILPILDYDVRWATPAYKHLDKWLAYVEKVVSRYKNDIKYWEVWNEPNLEGFWREKPDGANYKILLEATYKKIKEIDPSLVVLYAGTAGIPFEYIEKSFEAGGADYFDIFNIHPYRSGMSSVQASQRYENDIKKLRELMKKYNVDQKKIWITEFGWATPPANQQSNRAVLHAAKKILDPNGKNWSVAVLLDENYPASQSFSRNALKSFFPEGYDITFIELPDLKNIGPKKFNALYLPPSENFPTPYLNDIVNYVTEGGNLFLFGGVPMYYQTEYDKINKGMLVQKKEGARPDEDRRRLRISWIAWWTDKEKKTPEFAKAVPAEGTENLLKDYPSQGKASRFLKGNFLKEGDRLIPLLLGKEKDFEGIAAGIFKFDSDMKGSVVVNTIMGQNVVTTEEDQVVFLPQAILLSLRFGIERYFWYEFQSPERDDSDKEHHFGIVHQQLDPKPAYHAYSTLTRACPDGSKIDFSMPWAQGDLCVVSWTRKDGTRSWAVWAPNGEKEVSVKIGPGFRAAADIFGQKLSLTQQSDKITFGPAVIYFTGPEKIEFQQTLPSPKTTASEDPSKYKELFERIEQIEKNVDPETDFPWGTHGAPKGYHSNFNRGTKVRPTRAAADYAQLLLGSPKAEHWPRGEKVLDRFLDVQDRDPASKTFGVWPWYYEEPLDKMAAPDFNWADFNGAVLAGILHDYPDRLSPELLEKTRQGLDNCCRAIIKRDVKPSYTNIAMMGACVTAAGGELLNKKEYLDYGRMRMKRNVKHFRSLDGNFNEYNSPSYTPIVIREMERMLHLVKDPECRQDAEEILHGAWKTVAEHYHKPTGQWAGPHSRNYNDLFDGAGQRVMLFRAGMMPSSYQPFGYFVPFIACSENLKHFFKENPPKEGVSRQNLFNPNPPLRDEIGTTWMDDLATLGSASFHTFWQQARGLIAYWTVPQGDKKGVAVLRLRLMHDGEDFSSGCAWNIQQGPRVLTAIGLLSNWGSMHPSFDRPKDGVFKAKSFKIVYQLAAPGATARQLDENRFELSAGPVRAAVQVADQCCFGDLPIQWKIERKNDFASLVGICYEGDEKEFSLHQFPDSRIALGLELLEGDEKPTDTKIQFVDSDKETENEGKCYGVLWPGLNDDKVLNVPLKPIKR